MPRIRQDYVLPDGRYDLVKAFGQEEVDFLIAHGKLHVVKHKDGNGFPVSRTHYMNLKNKVLPRLHREVQLQALQLASKTATDETRKRRRHHYSRPAAPADANFSSSNDEINKPLKRKIPRIRTPSTTEEEEQQNTQSSLPTAAIATVEQQAEENMEYNSPDLHHSPTTAAPSTHSDADVQQSADLIVQGENVGPSTSTVVAAGGSAADIVSHQTSSSSSSDDDVPPGWHFAGYPTAAVNNKPNKDSDGDLSEPFLDEERSVQSVITLSEEDQPYNCRPLSPVRDFKKARLLRAIQKRAEEIRNKPPPPVSSPDCTLSDVPFDGEDNKNDDDEKSETASFIKKGHKLGDIVQQPKFSKPIVLRVSESSESDQQEDEVSDVVLDPLYDDVDSDDINGPPADYIHLPEEDIVRDFFDSFLLPSEIENNTFNETSAAVGEPSKSAKSILALEIEARVQAIMKEDPHGDINWRNIMRHIGSQLEIPEAHMTLVLQLLKATGIDSKLGQLPETGKRLMQPSDKKANADRYKYRPIPCGKFGTYAHYGLLDGLLGYSIGATSKVVRFYLDKVVEKFPQMFKDSVIEAVDDESTNAVSSKLRQFNKDMLKWRHNIIRTHEEQAARVNAAAATDDPDEIDDPVAPEDIYDPFNEEIDYLAGQRQDKADDDKTQRAADASSDDSNDENEQEEDDDDEVIVAPTAPVVPPKQAKKKKSTLAAKQRRRAALGFELSDEYSDPDVYTSPSAEEDDDDEEAEMRRLERSPTFKTSRKPLRTVCDECTGLHKTPYIDFEISGDGVKIHKKAVKMAAWPLMGQILFISPCIHKKDQIRFYMPRNSPPVILGFYYGTNKPSCANEFLRCVFKEMRLAEKRGICTMFLRFYIGDTPSRQFAKGFPSEHSYCGCERCYEEGVRLEKTNLNRKTGKPVKGHMAILQTRNLKLRTPDNYIKREYYKNKFPKEDNILYKYSLKTKGLFNILHNVPLDSMHVVYHCAITWLFEGAWITADQVKGGKFTAKLMKSVEYKLRRVKGCLPYAIQSGGVGTKPYAKFGTDWTCCEKRIFFLYVSIVVLNDPMMKTDAYKVLLSLHHAIMLLSGSRHLSAVPPQYLRKARENLLYAVEKCQLLYGVDFPRYTVHALLHIVDELEYLGCRLDYCSMFKYENSMKFFAHALDKRSGARVHAQIRNSLIKNKISDIVLPTECQRRRALLGHAQTGRDTRVENLSNYNPKTFGVINPVSSNALPPQFQNKPDIQFYQVGEEGNSPAPYEMHTTRHMKRLVYRDFTISTRYPNNIVLMKDLGACMVFNILHDVPSDSFRLVLAPFAKQGNFFEGVPCNSSDFGILKVTGGIDRTKLRTAVDAATVVNQLVCLLFDKVVDYDAPEGPMAPLKAATQKLNKKQSVFVCIPLMHGMFH